MEKWQVGWITKHLVELYELTRCTIRLIADIRSKEIISWDEAEELGGESVATKKVEMFYSILLKRKGSYDILVDALRECNQTGALEILENGKAEHLGKDPEQLHNKKFKSGPKGIQDFLSSSEQILLISTVDVEITITKIQQNIGRPVTLAENDRHLRELMRQNVPDSNTKTFLLKCRKFPVSDYVEKVRHWVSDGAKAILLIEGHKESSLNISRDSLNWTDLNHWFQEELLEKQVKNQIGWKTRSVGEILVEAGVEEELEDEKLIIELINNKTPALFRPLPDPFSYYIKRNIRSRRVLSQKVIFREEKSDIFLFTGIDMIGLSRCMPPSHSSDYSWSQVKQLSVNYILLEKFEDRDDFNEICDLAEGKGVHWIHHESGKFFWVKSGQGSMKRIQEATEDMTEESVSFSENEFISHLDSHADKYGISPVLIADSPGMGKSTLLQSIARKILEKCPGRKIVLLLSFCDIVSLVKADMINVVTTEQFENALLKLTTEFGPEIGKCVLKNLLRSSSKTRNEIKVELMLDGYDEIISDDLPLAKKLLTIIHRSYHSTRIWVATRPHFMHDLEEKLQVVAFAILPLNESAQVKLLTKYWQYNKTKQADSSNSTITRQGFVKFARQCLENFKQITPMTEGKKEDFCKIPRRCLLVAKVYFKDCITYRKRETLLNSEPCVALKVDLYETFVNKMLKIYSKRFAKPLLPEMKIKLLNIHYYFALHVLFPKCAPAFKAALKSDDVSMTDVLNLGIVESTTVELNDNPISFGHETIPEFLVARFVAGQLCENEKSSTRNHKNKSACHSIRFNNGDIGNLLFNGVLRTSKFKREILKSQFELEKFEKPVLASFLDSLLQRQVKSTNLGKIFRGRYTQVTACVYGNHLHLFKALRSGVEKVDNRILLSAVTKASKLFLEYICKKYDLKLVECDIRSSDTIPFDPQLGTPITLLHVAVESRDFPFVQFLLCQGFEKLVKENHPSIRDVVHSLDFNSKWNPKWLIEEKINVLERLVELNKELLGGRANIINQSSFKLRGSVHVELTLKLLDLDEDPLVKGVDDSTLLHSCSLLSGNDFHRVLMKLTEEQGKELVNVKTKEKGSHVLHIIAENMRQPAKETLEHLLKLGVNFAAVNSKGETCLHIAATFGNVQAARLFLEFGRRAIVNLRDCEGKTALDHLLTNKYVNPNYEPLTEFGELIRSYGATVSADGTSLHQFVIRFGIYMYVYMHYSLIHSGRK